MVDVCFFPVAGADSPPPYNGDPPVEAVVDCTEVCNLVHFDRESQDTTLEQRFTFERPPGYYYVQMRVVLYRKKGAEMFAQAEQFFFGRRPLHIDASPVGDVTFPVTWPALPIEAMQRYQTLRPQRKRPW